MTVRCKNNWCELQTARRQAADRVVAGAAEAPAALRAHPPRPRGTPPASQPRSARPTSSITPAPGAARPWSAPGTGEPTRRPGHHATSPFRRGSSPLRSTGSSEGPRVRQADHPRYNQFVPRRCFVRVLREVFVLTPWRRKARRRRRPCQAWPRGKGREHRDRPRRCARRLEGCQQPAIGSDQLATLALGECDVETVVNPRSRG